MTTCATCPAYEPTEDIMLDDGMKTTRGMCRMDSPKIFPAGAQVRPNMVQGFDAQIGFVSAYPGTGAGDWCMRHPQRADTLVYDRNEGFNRAPTLKEAQRFDPRLTRPELFESE